MCKCGARWSGFKANHCTVCHRTFSTERNGDAHRTGTFEPPSRRCLTDDELRAKGLEPKPRKGGVVWGASAPDPRQITATSDRGGVLAPTLD